MLKLRLQLGFFICQVLWSHLIWISDTYGQGWNWNWCAPNMGINRFQFILRALRFECIDNRISRQKLYRLTAIRDIFEDFVNRCKSNYSLSKYVTIDEILDAFCAWCPFWQYIANKPAKYCLKITTLPDAKTFYT